MAAITTNGNWTVTIDQDRTNWGQDESIPAVKYGSDLRTFFKPAKQTVRTQARTADLCLTDITGTGLEPSHEISVGSKKISNIYQNYNIDNDSKSTSRTGAQVLVEDNIYYNAANSVSGQEVILPVMIRTVAIVPTSIVNEDVVADAMKQHCGVLLANSATIAEATLERAKGNLM